MTKNPVVPKDTLRSEYLSDIVQCFQDLFINKPNKVFGQEELSQELYGQSIECAHETPISREIRILSEVEKIWIIYDIDGSGKIDQAEIADYLSQMVEPEMHLERGHVTAVFKLIDDDDDGQVDKKEMECFLKVLCLMQQNLSFKPSKTFIRKEVAREFDKKKEEEQKLKQKYEISSQSKKSKRSLLR